MAGTIEGGKSAATTNKKKYGPEFYARIGAMGGKKGRTGGFYANRDLAKNAGAKGGTKSKRVYTDEERQRMSELMKERWASGVYRRG